MTKEIDFSNLTYCFTTPNPAPLNFIRLKVPMHVYNDIKIEEDQKQFKSNLSEITLEHHNYSKKDQLDTIKILNVFITTEKKVLNYILIMPKLYLKLYTRQNREQDLKC